MGTFDSQADIRWEEGAWRICGGGEAGARGVRGAQAGEQHTEQKGSLKAAEMNATPHPSFTSSDE